MLSVPTAQEDKEARVRSNEWSGDCCVVWKLVLSFDAEVYCVDGLPDMSGIAVGGKLWLDWRLHGWAMAFACYVVRVGVSGSRTRLSWSLSFKRTRGQDKNIKYKNCFLLL